MSATSRGLGSGIVLGVVLILLGQQFGFFDMSDLDRSIELLVGGAVVFGILGGWIGRRLGRRAATHLPSAAAPPSG